MIIKIIIQNRIEAPHPNGIKTKVIAAVLIGIVMTVFAWIGERLYETRSLPQQEILTEMHGQLISG